MPSADIHSVHVGSQSAWFERTTTNRICCSAVFADCGINMLEVAARQISSAARLRRDNLLSARGLHTDILISSHDPRV
ncbi:hypothetical protein ASD00_08610 [Ensifer sp. Root31]|nr:hypothetical protein ASD00_08610 [Ensifer sp. Root31]